MASRASSAQRRSIAQTEAYHDLGVRGRKTGVFLKDTGLRDEHGMQPLDDIFSSPEKEDHSGAEEEEGEEDDITAPAPSAFMNGRPPARARSPPKTSLNSPARRPPGLTSSSPLRDANVVHGSPSGAKSVQRKLDFGNNPLANKPVLPRPNGVNGKGKGKAAAITNGHHSSEEEQDEIEEEEEEEEEDEEEEEEVDESMAMLDGGEDDAVEEEEVDGELEPDSREEAETEGEQEEPPPPSVKKNKGRPKKAAPPPPSPSPSPPTVPEEDAIVQSIEDREPSEEPEPEPTRAGKKRPRGPAKRNKDDAPQARKKAKTTSNHVGDEEGESSSQAPAPKRRGRKPKDAAAAAGAESTEAAAAMQKQKQKQKRADKRTSAGVGDTSVAEIPRGPPMPKGRGLVITRREDPGAGSGFTTRSGRTSYQPLKFWRNERAELDDEALLEDGKSKIVLPHVKNIVRVDEPEPGVKSSSGRRRTKASGKKGARRRGGFQDDDGDDDLEPWEEEGEVITGEVVVWQPEHEFDPPGPDEQIEVAPDEQIAVSANAIMTREIRNASFKFAKTLSMPFYGSGVVDLPPGTEKKPKNSRKMHMTFFVFAGRVTVTVADTLFSIGRGGMWFVPRGNYYSIENTSDKPARVFFSQGCEVSSGSAGDVSQMA